MKYEAGFYMGPDGYVWGRDFASKDPELARRTEMDKQWYRFMLWGRRFGVWLSISEVFSVDRGMM